ncbi:MAG TPA: prephenate/arogenate dehydrogenase family protein [Caulobacteraceae bacterium]|jgi:cyclohexadieny/prephenate dehydrogenase|nr:prephenate/arogenate dehydrogenase family protein [Caulobacteraceae bacterium]
MARVLYSRLAVIGCGLIGGSVVRAARAAGVVDEIAVAEINPAYRDRLAELDIADLLTGDAREAVSGADLVMLATFPSALEDVAREIGPHLKPGATITDVGSVKGPVGEALSAAAPPGVHVIPGHPIAGTELSGPDAGFAALFRDRWTILCPRPSADPGYGEAVSRLTAFWEALGARVEAMDEKHHDQVLAVTSHLPHLIAYTIVGTAAHLEEVSQGEVMKYSAGGFRDFTRIAASDPTMWRDVFLLNKDAVLEILGQFTEDLQGMSKAIRWGDGQALEDLFTRTREIRRGVIAAGQESAEPNFGRDKGRTS